MDERVRRRLRELRTARGLTLKAVAERSNLDLSTLSRLESGKRRLALDHLPALADALEVSVDDLMASPRRQNPRVRSRARTFDGLTMWPLTHQAPARGVQAFKVRIHPERTRPPAELPVHEGQDWMYVLSGRMRLILGEDELTIGPGEAVEFNTWTPHWFGAIDGPVELIFLVGPHGERLHLHR